MSRFYVVSCIQEFCNGNCVVKARSRWFFYNYKWLVLYHLKNRGEIFRVLNFFFFKSFMCISFLIFSLYIKPIIGVNLVASILWQLSDSYPLAMIHKDKFPTEITYEIHASCFFILFVTRKPVKVTNMEYDTMIHYVHFICYKAWYWTTQI